MHASNPSTKSRTRETRSVSEDHILHPKNDLIKHVTITTNFTPADQYVLIFAL